MIPHFSLTALTHSRGSHISRRPGPSDARIASALSALRFDGRRAIRILDLGCGNGERILRAVASAHALGFVAIEARGADASPHNIRAARRSARTLPHPCIDLHFDVAEPIAALAAEHDGAVDLVILAEAHPRPCSPLGIALARVNLRTVLAAD